MAVCFKEQELGDGAVLFLYSEGLMRQLLAAVLHGARMGN